MIKDPYGICALDQELFSGHWNAARASNAIWDFIDISKKWCRYGKTPFSPFGFSYKHFLNKQYMNLTYDYVSKITSCTDRVDTYSDMSKKSYLRYVFDRNRRYLEKKTKGRIRIANRRVRQDYLCKPSEQQFLHATKEYLLKLFTTGECNPDKKFILLDQAIPANDPLLCQRYFDNAKMIIVDRDPRDVFVDNMLWTDFLINNPNSEEEAKKFCDFFLAYRANNAIISSNILRVQFEDLINHYNEKTVEIMEFLGLKAEDHTEPLRFFNPSFSKKNVGIWVKYYSKFNKAIDYIQVHLKDYIYER